MDVTVRAGVTVPIALARLARVAAAALAAAHAPAPAALNLILSGDEELTALNEEHMAEHGPTDVLSFPLLPPAAFPAHAGQDPSIRDGAGVHRFVRPPGRRVVLGDIVVSVERAAEQAAQGRGGQTGNVHWSVADELRLLVVHGTLHVCGWDHAVAKEEAAMRALETAILDNS